MAVWQECPGYLRISLSHYQRKGGCAKLCLLVFQIRQRKRLRCKIELQQSFAGKTSPCGWEEVLCVNAVAGSLKAGPPKPASPVDSPSHWQLALLPQQPRNTAVPLSRPLRVSAWTTAPILLQGVAAQMLNAAPLGPYPDGFSHSRSQFWNGIATWCGASWAPKQTITVTRINVALWLALLGVQGSILRIYTCTEEWQ